MDAFRFTAHRVVKSAPDANQIRITLLKDSDHALMMDSEADVAALDSEGAAAALDSEAGVAALDSEGTAAPVDSEGIFAPHVRQVGAPEGVVSDNRPPSDIYRTNRPSGGAMCRTLPK